MNWIAVKDRLPPKFTPLVVWTGELSIASLEDDGWYLQDEDGYIYERVRCGSGCCWDEQKKKLWGVVSHWLQAEPPE